MTTTGKPKILIVDDQRDVLEALRLLLKSENYQVQAVMSPAAVLDSLKSGEFDVLLMDLNYSRDTTSGEEGLELIRQVRVVAPELSIIVMTAWGTIEVAVEAVRLGAGDFIEKPWDNNRLLSILRTQVELKQARQRSRNLEAENTLLRTESAEDFIAKSGVMKPVIEMIKRVGPSDANVMITGEPGTGKGMVARMIHEHSNRKDKSFIGVNVGGLAESVFESEMFGHVKGAFTDARSDRIGRFELADHGTIFLDEISNIPVSQQAKLLHVLEEGTFERVGSSRTLKVNVRVVSATNANLQSAIEQGEFRKDLFFRLNTVEIDLPPLRERKEDILRIAEHYLGHYATKYDRELRGFDRAAEQLLMTYRWPGNVRELNHVVERAVLMAAGDEVVPEDLRLSPAREDTTESQLDAMSLEDAERLLISNTLERLNGNVIRAAEALGLSRSALYRRIEKYGL